MNTLTAKSYYEIFKAQSERLLAEKQYRFMVSAEEQQKEIDKLVQTLHYEKFFFIFNNREFRAEQVYGIKAWLGHNESDFTIMNYFKSIHPSHLVAQMATDYELMESFISGQWQLQFIGHRVVNTIALQHSNGEYLLFKKLARPFQYDERNRLISYLNEFTLIGKYNNEPYTSRFMDDSGNDVDWKDEILKRTKKLYNGKKFFSRQEMRILNKFAGNSRLLSSDIARMFNIKESTVITYKKRIMAKAEELFPHRFKTAKHVAEYLKEQGLV